LKISPTILRTKLNETDILEKELFSSLLPVIGINDKESALKKENTRPFKVPENITMMVVDSKTGKKVSFASKKTLIESFKSGKVLEKTNISKKINNRFNNNNILRFY